MDNRKLRIAFAKVKKDILELREKVSDINKNIQKENNNKFDSNKFDNFVKNVEDELNSLRLIVKELEDKIEYNINNQTKKITKSAKSDSKIKELENKYDDYNQLIHEKIEMEINSLRLEMTEEIAKVYDRILSDVPPIKEDKELKKTNKKGKFKKKESKENEKVTKKSKSTKTENKKGNFRKIMNWIFVDEDKKDNDQIDNIKKEVKK